MPYNFVCAQADTLTYLKIEQVDTHILRSMIHKAVADRRHPFVGKLHYVARVKILFMYVYIYIDSL